MKNKDADLFFTITDIANKLNVDYKFVRSLVSTGKLSSYKLAERTIRISLSQFNDYLESSKFNKDA